MNTVTLKLKEYEDLCNYKRVLLEKGVYITNCYYGDYWYYTESDACKEFIKRIDALNKVIEIKNMQIKKLSNPKEVKEAKKHWFSWMR